MQSTSSPLCEVEGCDSYATECECGNAHCSTHPHETSACDGKGFACEGYVGCPCDCLNSPEDRNAIHDPKGI